MEEAIFQEVCRMVIFEGMVENTLHKKEINAKITEIIINLVDAKKISDQEF